MMKCIAIDDEPMALELLSEYIQKVPFLDSVATFRNAIEGLTYLQSNSVDLLFLDINMPDLTGIQFLKSLRNPPMVIFTTAYSEYALQGYELQVTDYLLKPIEFPRFLTACTKALELHQLKHQHQEKPGISQTNSSSDDSIFVKSGTTTHRISLSDLSYVEGTGNYVSFWINKKKLMSLIKMSDVESLLPGNFLRVHKSYIVNMNTIDEIERHQVTIQGKQIPIGSTYRASFLQKLDEMK